MPAPITVMSVLLDGACVRALSKEALMAVGWLVMVGAAMGIAEGSTRMLRIVPVPPGQRQFDLLIGYLQS